MTSEQLLTGGGRGMGLNTTKSALAQLGAMKSHLGLETGAVRQVGVHTRVDRLLHLLLCVGCLGWDRSCSE